MRFRLFLFLLLYTLTVKSQVQTIPSDNQVYAFLKNAEVKGILAEYDDVILPLSLSEIFKHLKTIDTKKNELTGNEILLLQKYIERFDPEFNRINFSDPADWHQVISNSEKRFYEYRDSSVHFSLNPVFSAEIIYGDNQHALSTLLKFGGQAEGSVEDWLGFYVRATNGVVTGDREVARFNRSVDQSFTFENTGLNYYDETSGQLRLKYGIAGFQVGRERLLTGTGYVDKMIISDNAQPFDFIRFSLSYKKLSYDFIHGWLTQKPVSVPSDSLYGVIKTKQPKYIALSRLGFRPVDNINLGISQVIIYANRPFEAAYANPFLFWESAQRSMNDLDNSFINLDFRWRTMPGFEIMFSATIDDLNLSRLFDQGWNIVDNRIAFQAGFLYFPVFIPDLLVKYEYTQIRPYTFSHAGPGESLAYTNNSEFLGLPFHPNSFRNTIAFNYLFNRDLNISLTLSRTDHGSNIYDENGKIITNFGGNIYESFSLNDSRKVFLLGGEHEIYYSADLKLIWEFIRNIDIEFYCNYLTFKSSTADRKNLYLSTAVKLFFQ